MVKVLYIWFV